ARLPRDDEGQADGDPRLQEQAHRPVVAHQSARGGAGHRCFAESVTAQERSMIACPVALAAVLLAAPPPPKAEKKPVATEYHGVRVVESYRWLEASGDPAVR